MSYWANFTADEKAIRNVTKFSIRRIARSYNENKCIVAEKFAYQVASLAVCSKWDIEQLPPYQSSKAFMLLFHPTMKIVLVPYEKFEN